MSQAPAGIVQELAERVQALETARRRVRGVVSSGYAAVDGLLPQGGFSRGGLVEWLAAEPGSGATSLALRAAREACGRGEHLVVIDARRTFYPLAAAAWGISLDRLLVVRPGNARDENWALVQALRSPAAGAVLAWPGDLGDHLYRRLQLAVEAGGGVGLLVRGGGAERRPSWAEARLRVDPVGTGEGSESRRVRVTVVRGRAARGRPWAEVRL